jgi:acyl-CoA thioester hydrolase
MTKKILPQPGESCMCRFRVRYAECDAQGYLHHAKYWEYFEHARTELLRNNGFRYRDLEAAGTMFVVYKAAVKYILPIKYDDLVDVTVTVARITRTRVDHSYIIERDDTKTCEATSTLACVGTDGKPTLMPEELWSQSDG